MVRKLEHDQSADEYFETCFMNPASALNKRYGAEMDYDTEEMLKLTYTKEQAPIEQEIIIKLDKLEHVRIGTYNRNHGEKTIIVAIKRNCDAQKKIKAAYKIMQCVANAQNKNKVDMADSRYLMSAKLFLYYLFGYTPLAIKPTIDEEMCSSCNTGNKRRITALQQYLDNNKANKDISHETEFMIMRLREDKKRNLSICIPASIEVYEDEKSKSKKCEFDGLVIFLNRREKQLLFLEAKNREKKPERGRRDLINRINEIGKNEKSGVKLEDEDQVIRVNMDAYFEYTINL